MERRIEELEIDLRVAEAKADLAIRLVRYLCDELGRSSAVNWDADDLFRQFLNDVDFEGPEEELARNAILPSPDEAEFNEATRQAFAIITDASQLREKIRTRIRHEWRTPS